MRFVRNRRHPTFSDGRRTNPVRAYATGKVNLEYLSIATDVIGWGDDSLQSSNRQQNPMEQRVWIRWAAGNVNVHGDDRVYAATTGVVLAENAATASARTDRHNQPRRGHGVVGLAKSEFHVACDWAGDEQHVRMTRGGDKVNAETFDVIDRAVEAIDFDFAAVAGASVHFPDMQ